MRQVDNSLQLPIDIAAGSKFGRYSKINAEKTYNMYVSDGWLINFAGYERVLNILNNGVGKGRGVFYSSRGNFVLAVVESAVYKISPSLGKQLIGNLNTATGEVFIDENLNNQIAIVDGVNLYIYNHSLPINLTVQSVPSYLTPNYVCYHNTFFLLGNGDTSGNGARWFAYEYATDTTVTENSEMALQTKPDYAQAIKRIPGQSNNVLVFGSTVCEIFTQVGGLQNYRRNSSVSIDYGCASVSTIAASDKYIAWLGINESNAPVIMIFTGQEAQAISTDGISHLMTQITRPDKSTALFYRQDGHLFYQVTFYHKNDNLTLAYDVDGGYFINLSDQNLNYHPARQVVYFNEDIYFVSLNTSGLYRWSTDITMINENVVTGPQDENLIYEKQLIRITNTIRSPKTTPFIANTVVIPIEQGSQPEGYNGRIDLSLSKDGGVTYSNTVSRELRPLAHRQNQLTWERMGLANELTLKFRFWMRGSTVTTNGVIDVVPNGGRGTE